MDKKKKFTTESTKKTKRKVFASFFSAFRGFSDSSSLVRAVSVVRGYS
jgi:hypothetical protein